MFRLSATFRNAAASWEPHETEHNQSVEILRAAALGVKERSNSQEKHSPDRLDQHKKNVWSAAVKPRVKPT